MHIRLVQVYAEYQFIRSNLTDPRFQLTDSLAEADILWLASHFKDYREFRCTSFQSCALIMRYLKVDGNEK